MAAFIRRLVRLVAYLSFTLVCMPVQAALLAAGATRGAARFPRWYHRVCCRLLGFRLQRIGRPSETHPTLFVANHSSYIDILVLGALLEASFVAKAEVAGWPLFGRLAKLQRSVFVDRQIRTAQAQRGSMEARLVAGDNLILFPEGTSNDGTHVLPFKSALFAAVGRAVDVPIQPVSVAYSRLDGIPLTRGDRPLVAWYGDMAMGPHLWTLIGLGTIDVVIEFHPAVRLSQFTSRKTCSDHCRAMIRGGVASAITGRRPPAADPPQAAVIEAVPA